MKPDELAKLMRERALLIDSDESLDEKSLTNYAAIHKEKAKRIHRLEEVKKLYFNAGRWVGGNRDHVARSAFERMRAIEK